MKIDQAEVVNDSGRELPKVPPKELRESSLILQCLQGLAKAFKCLLWRAYEVM